MSRLAAPAPLLDNGFHEEGDILVYVSPPIAVPGRTADWFFDEVARRDPAHLLLDIRHTTAHADDSMRRVVYRRHRELDGRRVAVVGQSRLQEFVITFLTAATGHVGVRYFKDEPSARAWLRGEGHA